MSVQMKAHVRLLVQIVVLWALRPFLDPKITNILNSELSESLRGRDSALNLTLSPRLNTQNLGVLIRATRAILECLVEDVRRSHTVIISFLSYYHRSSL